MNRAIMGRKLTELEQRASEAKQEHIVCTPMADDLLPGAVELAPGVYVSRYAYPSKYMTRQVLYTDRALLDEWLALPDQKDSNRLIYHVLSQAECDAIRAEVKSRI